MVCGLLNPCQFFAAELVHFAALTASAESAAHEDRCMVDYLPGKLGLGLELCLLPTLVGGSVRRVCMSFRCCGFLHVPLAGLWESILFGMHVCSVCRLVSI